MALQRLPEMLLVTLGEPAVGIAQHDEVFPIGAAGQIAGSRNEVVERTPRVFWKTQRAFDPVAQQAAAALRRLHYHETRLQPRTARRQSVSGDIEHDERGAMQVGETSDAGGGVGQGGEERGGDDLVDGFERNAEAQTATPSNHHVVASLRPRIERS